MIDMLPLRAVRSFGVTVHNSWNLTRTPPTTPGKHAELSQPLGETFRATCSVFRNTLSRENVFPNLFFCLAEFPEIGCVGGGANAAKVVRASVRWRTCLRAPGVATRRQGAVVRFRAGAYKMSGGVRCCATMNRSPVHHARTSNATHTRAVQDCSCTSRGNIPVAAKERWRSPDPAETLPNQCNSHQPHELALPAPGVQCLTFLGIATPRPFAESIAAANREQHHAPRYRSKRASATFVCAHRHVEVAAVSVAEPRPYRRQGW